MSMKPKKRHDAEAKRRPGQILSGAQQGLDKESQEAAVLLLEELKRNLVWLDLLLTQKVAAKIREDGVPVFSAAKGKGKKAA
jgi:hypothetical protein